MQKNFNQITNYILKTIYINLYNYYMIAHYITQDSFFLLTHRIQLTRFLKNFFNMLRIVNLPLLHFICRDRDFVVDSFVSDNVSLVDDSNKETFEIFSFLACSHFSSHSFCKQKWLNKLNCIVITTINIS